MPLFCRVRYFIEISYKGTNYSGWQIQPNSNTIQTELNSALSTLLGSSTETMGSGRTDAGVHAHGMIAHFDSEKIDLDTPFIYKLNAILPKDIAIRSIRPVTAEAHARFDAISRSYQYILRSQKDPFSSNTDFFYTHELDTELIDSAIEKIINYKDFQAFSKVHTGVNNFNCDIFEAKWERSETGHVFYIRANRFLRGMVRTVVGTLLDIGTKKISLYQLTEILESRDRTKAGRAVPASGLYFLIAEFPKNIYQ